MSGPGGPSFLLFCRSVSCLFATYPPLGVVLVAFLHLLSISDWVYIFSVSLDNSFGPDLPYQVGCRLRIFSLSVGFSASCSWKLLYYPEVVHTFQADVDYMCTGESKERQLQFTNGLC